VKAVKIQKSAQDYLETMLMLHQRRGFIRSVDVAEQMGVTKPSVSYATKRLRENGYITMDGDGLITLTQAGLDIAQSMYERHTVLTEVLMQLGVAEEIAREDACKMEHDISQQTFEALRRHLEQYRK
jgi:Mn-dependent DtxR family transcriptional regulator